MNSLVESMFQTGMYKRTQGRKVRQGTAYAIALIFLVAAFKVTSMLEHTAWAGGYMAYIIGVLIFALGAWIAFRIVNWPKFADFLISVEAEMNKVSWPTRTELIHSSIVVVAVLFLLAVVLLLFDVFWEMIIHYGFKFLNWIFP